MINDIIKNSIKNHKDTLDLIEVNDVKFASEILIEKISSKNNIFWCGNGGSASQANHLSSELIGGMFKKKIPPFKSHCLNIDSSFITAWSNDDSFDNIFSRQLEALAKRNDLLICLTTSGNSKNIIKAAEFASKNKIDVISFTGNDGGNIKNLSKLNINIASTNTQHIQEMHILIGHILCEIVEKSYSNL